MYSMYRNLVERRRSYIRNQDFKELMYICYETPKSLESLCEECDMALTEVYSMIHDLEEVGLVKSVNSRVQEDPFCTADKKYVVNRWLISNYPEVMLQLERL